MTDPNIHDDVQQLAYLLGTWRGAGKGEYPSIEPFTYEEEVTFTHVGKPFLVYRQRTWHPEKRFPMHGESGYWRSVAPGRVEIVLAHPFGITEIDEGTVEGTVVDVRATSIGSTSTAKEVTALARRFEVEGDVLSYDVSMAAAGHPLTGHLRAELRRVGS